MDKIQSLTEILTCTICRKSFDNSESIIERRPICLRTYDSYSNPMQKSLKFVMYHTVESLSLGFDQEKELVSFALRPKRTAIWLFRAAHDAQAGNLIVSMNDLKFHSLCWLLHPTLRLILLVWSQPLMSSLLQRLLSVGTQTQLVIQKPNLMTLQSSYTLGDRITKTKTLFSQTEKTSLLGARLI